MRRRGTSVDYRDARLKTLSHSKLWRGRIPMVALVQMLAVAEYLSFQRAAQALGTSQSSVSARIRALEEDLGIIVFDRNTRGVRLTEAGRIFVEQVHQAIDILDHAVKTAGMKANGEDGELRIGVHGISQGSFLDRLLEQFHRQHPGVRLNITESTAREAQLMVRERKLDIAFMAGVHEIPDLNSTVIWRDRLMVGLSKTHPLATHTDVEWRQLAQETFLVRHGGTGPQVHDLLVLRSAGKWPTPHMLRHDVGRSALLSMVAVGQGISLFAEEATTSNATNITFLPISDEPETIPFSAVWSPRNRDPVLLKLLALASTTGHSTLESDSR